MQHTGRSETMYTYLVVVDVVGLNAAGSASGARDDIVVAEPTRVHVLSRVLLSERARDRLHESTRSDVPQLQRVTVRP